MHPHPHISSPDVQQAPRWTSGSWMALPFKAITTRLVWAGVSWRKDTKDRIQSLHHGFQIQTLTGVHFFPKEGLACPKSCQTAQVWLVTELSQGFPGTGSPGWRLWSQQFFIMSLLTPTRGSRTMDSSITPRVQPGLRCPPTPASGWGVTGLASLTLACPTGTCPCLGLQGDSWVGWFPGVVLQGVRKWPLF